MGSESVGRESVGSESMGSDHDPLAAYLAQHATRALEGLRHLDAAPSVELVHDTRTSLRRLRATVRTFPQSFPDLVADDADLQWVALGFGAVRDTDVLAELLLPLAESLSTITAAAPSSEQHALAAALTSARERALTDLAVHAEEARWTRAVGQLERWSGAPPSLVTPATEDTLRRARDTVRGRLSAADGQPTALHLARKAAKRWRYAAELLAPVEPAAQQHLEEAQQVQEVLGELQDTMIGTEFLDGLQDPGMSGIGALRGRLLDALNASRSQLVARAESLL
ncbi:CHAD domain-containing protein [uncultured Brachybacterium sp.]|uniref:CHAD domain-containing protein n=1 Tax=uncultured Brachybacterium sp. TaxID=189680 RepID=UPI00260FDFF1|nr:CHAD domain-containing protein [uncultured Brachybacterium sp.]